MSGEAGRAVLPECVVLSGAVMESFRGVFGVPGNDLEVVATLALRGVAGPRPAEPRCPVEDNNVSKR